MVKGEKDKKVKKAGKGKTVKITAKILLTWQPVKKQ